MFIFVSGVVVAFSCRSSQSHELTDTEAPHLHLDNVPYASGGLSGNVVLGEVKGQQVAVKLAPVNSTRGEVHLFNFSIFEKGFFG